MGALSFLDNKSKLNKHKTCILNQYAVLTTRTWVKYLTSSFLMENWMF